MGIEQGVQQQERARRLPVSAAVRGRPVPEVHPQPLRRRRLRRERRLRGTGQQRKVLMQARSVEVSSLGVSLNA